MNVICFHNPEEENGVFSNWYLSDFEVDGVKYTSLEQYMMHQKAVRFHDDEIAKEIMGTTDVAEIKGLGRKVHNYDGTYWNGVRQVVVYNGLLAKFSQNEELKKILLDTGDELMAECSATDRIWGNGISMYDERRFDVSEWNGQNLMGYNLMLVREMLKKQCSLNTD